VGSQLLYWCTTVMIGLLLSQISAVVIWSGTLVELLKVILLWLMPLLVFFVVSKSVFRLGKSTWLILGMLAIFELISNTCSSIAGLICGSSLGLERCGLGDVLDPANPYLLIPSPPAWWNPTVFMAISIPVGAYMQRAEGSVAVLWQRASQAIALGMKVAMPWVARMLLLGYLCNLFSNGSWNIFVELQPILTMLIPALLLYLLILHAIAARFDIGRLWQQMASCLPAAGIAFCSCSSLDALPWSIKAARQNCQSPDVAEMVSPITASIQMPGDCFINLFLMGALLPMYGRSLPDGFGVLLFLMHFVVNRFAAVGIPGGALMLMLPLYERYLSAPPHLLGLMIVLNAILDPVVAASNVFGNGALVVLFERAHSFAARFKQGWRHLKGW